MNRLIRAFTSVTIAFIMTMVSVIPFNMTVLADEPEVSIPEQTPVTYSAFILNRMISNADGTMTLERADIRDKGAYDSDVFAAGNKIRLLKEHIDPELKAGDMALAWQNEDGWHAVRAGYEEIILTDDPEYTSAESADPGDLVLSNRYSNFIDTMRYFGFTQGEDAAEVTVWLLPEDEASDEVKEAIGFTSASSGKELLKKAIDAAQDKLDSVKISADGRELDKGVKWVTKEAYDTLDEVIKASETLLNDEGISGSEFYDFQIYNLYIALNGTGYGTGFDNEIRTSSETILARWTDQQDQPVTDSSFDRFFEGSAEDGVEALLDAGKVSVNGIVLPDKEPEGTDTAFTLNGVHAIWKLENGRWTWQSHDKMWTDEKGEGASFEEARMNFVSGITQFRGMTTELVSEDGGSFATAIRITAKNAGQAEKITRDSDTHMVTVLGVPVDETSYNTDGGPNDKEARVIPEANFDNTIKEGDTVLYWYGLNEESGKEEWFMERPVTVTGLLKDGSSSNAITLITDGKETVYQDALILRYSMQAGSRPHQVIDAKSALKLNDVPVTLYLTDTGYVIGISHLKEAGTALDRAIAYVSENCPKVKISSDGSDVTSSAKWVTPEVYDNYKNALEQAISVSQGDKATDAQKDAAVYALGNAYGGRRGLINQMKDGTIFASVVINMGEDKTVTDKMYDSLYKGGNAEAGVMALIAEGRVQINGFTIPASEEAFREDGFTVNEADWIETEEGGTYKVDRSSGLNWQQAALAALLRVSNGNEIRLYDEDQDGYADSINALYVEAMIADEVRQNEDGTVTVSRKEPDGQVSGKDGRAYDGDKKSITGITSDDIQPGDMILFKKTPSGWEIERPLEVNGILNDGKDHEFYQIDSTSYSDAMRFSRDNIIISNRCGELVNAHRYFGFIGNEEGLKVSLWLVNTSDPSKQGAPAGFTTGENAAEFLKKAIACAKERLESIVVSEDGSGLAMGTRWAPKQAADDLNKAIERAQKVLDQGAVPSLMDHQVYLLYFALNGSGQDIGARFAGYDYKGFDNETSVMPGTILINMGEDKTVTDEMYDSLYNGGNAEAGVKALIAEGKVSINGFVIPKTEDEFKKEGFKVNEAEWIIPEENGTYKVDRTGGLNWQQAALAALMRVSNGNEVRLYDEDGNGKVDRIDALYAEAMIAEKIEQKTEEGTEGGKDKVTYTVTRADIEKSPAFEGKDGRPYDGEVSSLTADEAYFDTSIQPGDMILFHKEPAGWIIERAKEVKGILKDGKDHEYYRIDDTSYEDAMRFSRDNIIISNRCGELLNAHEYFGFTDNDEDLTVSLWFVNTTDPSKWGAPCGFTTGKNAGIFLEKAIKIAEDRLENVIVSTDGSDLPSTKMWVTKEAKDELEAAIGRAKKVLASDAPDVLKDHQVYLLYLELNGSGEDIGARFAGYDYEGFDNRISPGRIIEVKDVVASLEMATGSSLQLNVKVKPFDALDKSITWMSTDTDVATVTDGYVTALRYGHINIIATAAGGKQAVWDIRTRYHDVNNKSGQYYYDAVYWAADNGITKGYDNVYFGPELDCQRREMMIFLWRISGRQIVGDVDLYSIFSDMSMYSPTTDTYRAVAWGYKNGIIKGYSDGTFRPHAAISRKDTMIMIYRLAGKPEVSGDISFTDTAYDVRLNPDTYHAILWADKTGISHGYTDGTYRPEANCLREHIVTFLYRYESLYD